MQLDSPIAQSPFGFHTSVHFTETQLALTAPAGITAAAVPVRYYAPTILAFKDVFPRPNRKAR
jgi:hypothetical protein